MLFIKRAKILSTCLYEFFEGGDIDTIATSPDKLVRRTNQATFSDLRKSGIHQAFGEFVVHTCIVAVLPRRVEKAASSFHLLLRAITARRVRFTPKSGNVQCTSVCPLYAKSRHLRRKKACPLHPRKRTCAVHRGDVRFVPKANSCNAAKWCTDSNV